MRSFPQVDTSARQRGFEIRVFPLLCELQKAIEPHLPDCQMDDPITVAALRVGFLG